ncbi:hypothetical protein [Streptomyces sp. NPDC021096]|uniref:hypothetical protein n=1 Tax=Streptomyces sp. NPDC021096 TaxID=3154792 RepID=UPI0033CD6955
MADEQSEVAWLTDEEVGGMLQIQPDRVQFAVRKYNVRTKGHNYFAGTMQSYHPDFYHPDDIRRIAGDLARGTLSREELLAPSKEDQLIEVVITIVAGLTILITLIIWLT